MASVKPRLPGQAKPQSSTAPAVAREERRRERRILLPSNRVAVFLVPNVGEFIELRTEASRRAAIAAQRRASGLDGESPAPTGQEIAHEMGRLMLRRQLVGLTARPVASIYKPGFDVEAVRAKAEKESAERVESGQPALDIDAIVATAEDAAEDTDAMKESARPERVNDVVWDEHEGEVGAYLASMPSAYLDTPEGADWKALHDFAALAMPAIAHGADSPKAQRPRIRNLR